MCFGTPEFKKDTPVVVEEDNADETQIAKADARQRKISQATNKQSTILSGELGTAKKKSILG